MSDRTEQLRTALEEITAAQKTVACGVAVRDFETGFEFSHHGDRVFHAASTIKVAILLALMKLVDERQLQLTAPLHVRNRFLSAVDATPYRLDSSSDGFPQLYRSVGRTAKIADLAESMITSSSNLATNLLLDFIGNERAAEILRDAGVKGVHLRRGVADDKAFDAGLNNETTAQGLVELFAVLRGDFLSRKSRDHVIHILLQQRFTSMIPAGLPSHATVAHKTGEISTACHDAGIVYVPEREPYIVAILTEVEPEKNGRRETVAKISEAVFRAVTGKAAAK
ncbi:MAG: serine hydrolase [Chthoniobacterales bacterium]|nr:serine hydrolase [Chthoniobacterales bacterium]